jgi:ATP-dependent Lon protease
MAYTTAGGDLLPLEVTFFPGKGNITITGNLKETMKESAQVALGYVRANAAAFGIASDFDFNSRDIHIHVPNGGVPKDGPSAGVALTTAIISALTKRTVPSNISMTGEIMLRGKVGIIGGVKEKIISAARGGISEVFLPKDNERYLEDVPSEILDTVTVHLVEQYMEIYNAIFANGKTNQYVKKPNLTH